MTRTLAIVVLGLVATTHAMDITTCGQFVNPRDTGVLQADLDCGSGPGITLAERAKLNLNGHVIAGVPSSTGFAIDCHAPCVIFGPGSVSGGAILGNGVKGSAKATLQDVDIDGACLSGSTLKLRNVHVTNSHCAPSSAVNANRVDARDVSIVNGDGGGIVAVNVARLRDFTATGNADAGVKSYGSLSLRDATVTGNDGGGAAIDIESYRRPHVKNAACIHSAHLVGSLPNVSVGPPWGVCSGD